MGAGIRGLWDPPQSMRALRNGAIVFMFRLGDWEGRWHSPQDDSSHVTPSELEGSQSRPLSYSEATTKAQRGTVKLPKEISVRDRAWREERLCLALKVLPSAP